MEKPKIILNKNNLKIALTLLYAILYKKIKIKILPMKNELKK